MLSTTLVEKISILKDYFEKINNSGIKLKAIEIERNHLERICEQGKEKINRLEQDKKTLAKKLGELEDKLAHFEKEKYELRKAVDDYAFWRNPDEFENDDDYNKSFDEERRYYLRYHATDCQDITAFNEIRRQAYLDDREGLHSYYSH